jgi:hypothetical protein
MKEYTFIEAKEYASILLQNINDKKKPLHEDNEIVLDESRFISMGDVYVFFYNTKAYVRTKNIRFFIF